MKSIKQNCKAFFGGAVLVSALVLAGPALGTEKIKIVTSFSILGDMVEQVVGDHASITNIVGSDADAHIYQPDAKDAKAISEADIIFVNGLGFETWLKKLIATSGTTADVIEATEGVTPLKVNGEIDPHAWNNLENGVIYVNNIARAMADTDTGRAAIYEKNAKVYTQTLRDLHHRAQSAFNRLSTQEKIVVTVHDAFGYMAAAYGLTFLAPLGIDTDAEPSAQALAKLIDYLKEVDAGALFLENVTSPALIQQIARETGLEIGGKLFSDALSERSGEATSYINMFEHNFETIIQALRAET